ncbi:MAG: anthranilate synthase component I [Verrucomicrobia bacterium]|nr:anthranilate synthase component I [Verrucomicrobiota bacterium]
MTSIPISPSRDEFIELAKRGNLIPVCTEFIADYETPIGAFEKIDDGRLSFLLESAESNDHVGRFSFLGSSPRVYLESRGRNIVVEENGERRTFQSEVDPLAEMRRIMDRYQLVRTPDLPPFVGGAVGYLGFDIVRFFEPTVGEPPPDALDLPESVFLITDTFLVFDHRSRRLKIFNTAFVDGNDAGAAFDLAAAKIRRVVEQLNQPIQPRLMNSIPNASSLVPKSNTTPAEYLEMVERCKRHIEAGDVFQIVPSQRFETNYTGDPVDLYRALRFINPSPYLFYLRLGERFGLVGSSPEVHVRLQGRKIEIRPLAGTRRRGTNPEEDQRLAAELLADPKERAEHLMLVDLARNDVGRICRYGSVKVSDFMTIERYSHVMHIVSNVEGELNPDKTADDVMRATFPAGTVSGTPKVRAMQLINEFEKNKRGVYAGAVGYFGFDGNLDSCIALRTIVLKDGVAYGQAGAGIVADSKPAEEHQECINKAAALFRATEHAQPKS